ncbi:MAG: hypothetical protein IJ608_02715 [Lachnospiraceae bacterium]|nr:hypothetical protein [Lachnospiraceae bacterium]
MSTIKGIYRDKGTGTPWIMVDYNGKWLTDGRHTIHEKSYHYSTWEWESFVKKKFYPIRQMEDYEVEKMIEDSFYFLKDHMNGRSLSSRMIREANKTGALQSS